MHTILPLALTFGFNYPVPAAPQPGYPDFSSQYRLPRISLLTTLNWLSGGGMPMATESRGEPIIPQQHRSNQDLGMLTSFDQPRISRFPPQFKGWWFPITALQCHELPVWCLPHMRCYDHQLAL
jgi:hypothetical protein